MKGIFQNSAAYVAGLVTAVIVMTSGTTQAGPIASPNGEMCAEAQNLVSKVQCLGEVVRQLVKITSDIAQLAGVQSPAQPAQPAPPAATAKVLKFLHPQAVAQNGYSCVGLQNPHLYVSCLEQMAQSGHITTIQMVLALQLLAAQQGVQAMEGPVIDLKAGQAYYIWAPSGIQEGTPDLARPLFGTRASEFSNNVFNAAVANSRKVSASGPHALWVIPTE